MTAPTLDGMPGQAVPSSATEPGKRELSLAQRLALGSRLAELREAANYTQLEVARKALGFTVSHAAVSRLERGVFGVVDNAKLDKLAAFYGATVESLLSEMEGRVEGEEPEEYRPADSLTVQSGCAQRLFHLRQAAGLTKLQMCEALGYGPNGVSLITQWERGEVTPQPDTLTDIAVALQVSAAWLITGKRAKPAKPTLPMRLRAMQKLYDLSNRDVALLAELDIANGAAFVGRMTRGKRVGDDKLVAVARALDVPVDWIRPPEQGFDEAKVAALATQAIPAEGLSAGAMKFLCELSDLFASAVLKESDIAKLRQRFMKDLIASQMPRRKNSPVPSLA